MIFLPLWRKHEGVRLHGFNIVLLFLSLSCCCCCFFRSVFSRLYFSAIFDASVTDKPTTAPSTTTTGVPTTLVKNVRITEGDDFTLNCTTEINTHEWSREEGTPDISKERTLENGEFKRISSSATVKDSGKYLCKNDKEHYIFNVSVKGREIRNQHDSFIWVCGL